MPSQNTKQNEWKGKGAEGGGEGKDGEGGGGTLINFSYSHTTVHETLKIRNTCYSFILFALQLCSEMH